MRVSRPSRSVFGAAGCLLALSLMVSGCGEGMNTSADPAVQASLDAEAAAAAEHEGMEGMDGEMTTDDGHGHTHESEGNGLDSALQGLVLADVATTATSDAAGEMSLRIELDNGATARGFTNIQGKPMHLYVVSKDLSTYVHTHPIRDAQGTWTAEMPALPAGPAHVVANFSTDDVEGVEHTLTLGTDVTVDGSPAEAVPLPDPAPSVEVDGYTVTLGEELAAGVEAKLNLSVTKDGAPATLEPYLDAWSHTSAFATDTLAQTHLHPAQEWKEGAASPETLTFVWTPEAPGTYRFFIEFMAEGELHRAEFTRSVAG